MQLKDPGEHCYEVFLREDRVALLYDPEWAEMFWCSYRVVPVDMDWSDIGSWKSLYDFLEKDDDNNVIDGDVIAQDTRNCLILGDNRLIAANRLDEAAQAADSAIAVAPMIGLNARAGVQLAKGDLAGKS